MRALGKITIFIIVPFLTFGQKLTYIPDNNFEQELIHLGYDDVLDNWVLTESIDTITSLTVNWEWISDLTGIEDFISLIYLDCSGNCINDSDEDGECDEIDFDDGLEIDMREIPTLELIQMIDVFGRVQKEHRQGELLFYLYKNGEVQKIVKP